jgi:hypothetical protein
MHSRTLVKAGAVGEIVRTPAFFCTTYSLRFLVHDKEITVHGVHRHEFYILGSGPGSLAPGFPPVKRFPQPHRVHADGE